MEKEKMPEFKPMTDALNPEIFKFARETWKKKIESKLPEASVKDVAWNCWMDTFKEMHEKDKEESLRAEYFFSSLLYLRDHWEEHGTELAEWYEEWRKKVPKKDN